MSDQAQSALMFTGLCIGVTLAILLIYWWSGRKTEPSTIKLDVIKTARSWAANQLRQEFYGLPAGHRPDADIDSIVHALDTKHTITAVDRHFRITPQMGAPYNWKHVCEAKRCPFSQYVDLHLQFVALQEAYDKKEHALAVAEQQYGFEQMDSLSQQLVNETLSLADATQEIKENGHRPD